MSEQDKKHQRIYDLLYPENVETKFLCLPNTKQKKKKNPEKELFKEKGD